MASWVKVLALHGMSADAWKRFGDEGYKHYFVVDSGFKYNMTDMQAALGIHQLQRIERYHSIRSSMWDRYIKALSGLPIGLPSPPEPETRHAFHLFTILVDKNRCGITRDQFIAEMTFNNIGVGVHYISMPEHPFYQERFGWKPEHYPHATQIGRQTVSLPLSPKLTDGDVSDVIHAVKQTLQ
jgi:dTDP-4-amino-4,6-dideoxygalactose transaminase